MLVTFLIIAAIIITILCIRMTAKQKKNRIVTGVVVILFSILGYPLLVPLFGEWMALEGVASLIVFHFLLLVGGVITLITGFFTKSA
ncbi:hypothetical protein [Bacillus sp. AK128]